MNSLHDYLDFDELSITTTDGRVFIGAPICVNYSDDTGLSSDEIVIEKDNVISLTEEEIETIEVLK